MANSSRSKALCSKRADSVVIIDDVATTGKAFVESIEVLQKMNIKIKKAICIIDRGEGAPRPWPSIRCL